MRIVINGCMWLISPYRSEEVIHVLRVFEWDLWKHPNFSIVSINTYGDNTVILLYRGVGVVPWYSYFLYLSDIIRAASSVTPLR